MRGFNKVVIAGNLVSDPELKKLPDGRSYVSTALAINSMRGSGEQRKEHVDYVDVAIYGKKAENIAQYCKKGSPVLIEGRLAQQRWVDKPTGQNRSKLGVIADHVTF